MLINQTREKMEKLKFTGMLQAFDEQMALPEAKELSFEQRLGLLIDREIQERENRRLKRRLRQAKLRQNATIEDIDFKSFRGLDKSVILSLAQCEWIKKNQNIIITGPTGVGKTYLACALAQKACREGYTALYNRLPRLFEQLAMAKGDGLYGKLLDKIAKSDLLVLDDWGLSVLTESQRKDLIELIEDRSNLSSTIIATQLPITKWHEVINDQTIADAILDRLVHNAHKINMEGDSMRKKINKVPTSC
ncbi:MAG: IS21-like element helper ATPase IstB [Candidatus Aminicenantes bacterium]|nr:IS21-like element helper ATPase IstB [Candidatus Aminicenantes bacterium]